MNRIIHILAVISLSCLFCQCSKKTGNVEEYSAEPPEGELIIIEGCCFPDVVDAYDYPVKNGSEEWKTMTADKKDNACQLPDDVLKKTSTLGLIRSFLDIPNSFVLIVLNSSDASPYRNYNRLFYSWYNSAQELLTRKDAVKSLIDFYSATTFDCLESLSEEGELFSEVAEFYIRLKALEFMFASPEILDRLVQKDKVEIVKLLLDMYKQKKNMGIANYSVLSVMIWIMYDDMLSSFSQSSLDSIKHGEIIDYLVDSIIAFAESFINKN